MSFFIKRVRGREIIDSRGNPTVEAEVTLECGISARASVPSGASTGEFEAVELRDGDKKRFMGLGVSQAVQNISQEISPALCGKNPLKQEELDNIMIELDGTDNKSRLGGNATLAVSIACARAAAAMLEIPLYRYIGGCFAHTLPMPMMNILNGGAHADNNLDVQEFMILPVGAKSFANGLRQCCEVYHTLKKLLKSRGLSTAIGDEGGFAPSLQNESEAIELILQAVEQAGYKPGADFMISLDAAASEWKGESIGEYNLPKKREKKTSEELISSWSKLRDNYPIFSIEDPLDENDWDGWAMMTEKLEHRLVLVGDDLFVTNHERLKKGIALHCGNAILIKPNQIGTLTETARAVFIAKHHGYRTIMSHRSGETEDTTIADLAVGLSTGLIKTGAPCRTDRTAKYNRLLRIEEQLGNTAEYGLR